MRGLYIKYLVIALICAHFFYECNLIPAVEQISKLLYYIIVLFLWIRINKIYKNVIPARQLWADNPIKILLFLLFFSIFNAFLFSGQSLFVGLMASFSTIIAYAMYFLCKKMRLEWLEYEKIIYIVSFGYLFALFIDLLTISSPIFGTIEFDLRGVRFRIPGFFFSIALFLMTLNKYTIYKKKIYLLYSVVGFLGVAVLLARQSLFYCLIFGFLLLFKSVKLYKKIIYVTVICLLSLYVIPKLELYQNLVEISTSQIEKNEDEDDIRLKGYNFFLFDYDRAPIEYAFGCGIPSYGNSGYGDKIQKINKETAILQADVSWAAFVFYFGYIPAIILLALFIKSFLVKLPPERLYVKYLLCILFLTSFAGGALIFQYELVLILMSFYMVFYEKSIKRKMHK